MKVLGLTGAFHTTGAAICSDDGMLSELSLSDRMSRSEKLIPLTQDLLVRVKLKLSDIDAVAVTIGPGSYSGLRGALAAAKGLAHAAGIKIVPVPTLMAVAYNFRDRDGTVAVAVNAMKDEYNFALFGINNGMISRSTGDIVSKESKLIEVLSKVSGEIIVAAHGDIRKKLEQAGIRLAGERDCVAWASNTAMIGMELLKSGKRSDLLSLVPEYSHKPNIREFKK